MFYDCDIVFILLEKYFLFAEYYQFTLLYTTRIRFVGFDNGNYVFLQLNFTIKVCINSIYILCWPKVNFLYLLCYKMAKDLKNVFGACLQDYLFVCLFVWGLSSHSRIFHSYGYVNGDGDVTIAGKRLQILTYTRHL